MPSTRDTSPPERPVRAGPAPAEAARIGAPAPVQPEEPLSGAAVLRLQRHAGNAAVSGLVGQRPAAPPGTTRTVQREPGDGDAPPPATGDQVAFVREAGLSLRASRDGAANSLAQLRFGQRLHVLDTAARDGWRKVAVAGQAGYVAADRIHFPPPQLIAQDPGLALVKVGSRQSFWGLVKDSYHIQGNEGTPDQNINHFINAIRAVNKPSAFRTRTDTLDDIGNVLVPGRDASDTELIAGVDLWIPSFGVAAAMDVGSGTVTGEAARLVKRIQQKIDDFIAACKASGAYIPAAIGRRAGEMGEGLLTGLVEFAKDAAEILAVSTAIGTLVGALFGGVGAAPGAEIGFEIGLKIIEYYGLYMLVEAVLGVAGAFLSELGRFISLVWNANGNPKQIDTAGQVLADALGLFVSAVMVAVAAYLMKRGAKALSKTKFAQKVGETRLARWYEARQQMTTTRDAVGAPPSPAAIRELARQEAKRLLARAGKDEAMVTNTLNSAATSNNGRLVGLENRLKTEESLTRKINDQAAVLIARGVPPAEAMAKISAGIKDALRYTVEAETASYMEAYQRTVKALEAQGCTRAASKNTWAQPGSSAAGAYRGINESWRTPDGQVFEVQFHTPESFSTKTETHGWYDEMRDPKTPPARAQELLKKSIERSDKIPVPPGAVPVNGVWPGGPGGGG